MPCSCSVRLRLYQASTRSVPLPKEHRLDAAVAVSIDQFGKGTGPCPHLKHVSPRMPERHPSGPKGPTHVEAALVSPEPPVAAPSENVDNDVHVEMDSFPAGRGTTKNDVPRRSAAPPRRRTAVNHAPMGNHVGRSPLTPVGLPAGERWGLLSGWLARIPEATLPGRRKMALRNVQACPGVAWGTASRLRANRGPPPVRRLGPCSAQDQAEKESKNSWEDYLRSGDHGNWNSLVDGARVWV